MSENMNAKKSSAATILLAWVLVGAPLAWGVYNTLLNSMRLFQAPATTTIVVPAGGATKK
jgi:hypothetical protein